MKRTQLAVVVMAMGSLGAAASCRTEFVTPLVASRVVVAPDEASVLEGEALQFTATVTDESNQAVVQAVVTWSTNDPSIVRVDPDGRAWALAPGATLVWASFNGTADSALMTVAPAAECEGDALAPEDKPKTKKDGKKKGHDDDDDDEPEDDDPRCPNPANTGT